MLAAEAPNRRWEADTLADLNAGQVIDLNTRVVNLPDTVILTTATAINDAGVIVGNGCLQPCDPFQSSGTAYMLIPKP